MKEAERRERIQKLAALILQCETEAHQMGLLVAANTLNNAKNALGWEAAGDVEIAAMASKGRRIGEPT